MIRMLHVSVASLVLTGQVFAQVAPPAPNAPGAAQGPGRVRAARSRPGKFRTCCDRPSSPCSARGRDPAAHAAGVGAGERRAEEVDRRRQVATKPLLEKFESLMMLQPPRLNVAATYTQTQQRMGPRHLGFVETASKGNIDLLLHGDSITDWWVQGDANKAMFDKYFGNIKTANFAIAGDTTQGVLWGLKNGEGQGFQPKADHADDRHQQHRRVHRGRKSPKASAPSCWRCGTTFPNAKILLLAIFPRGMPGDPVRDKIAEVNRIISKLDDQQHVFYLDIGAKFLDEKGVLPPGYVPARQPAPGRPRDTTFGARP